MDATSSTSASIAARSSSLHWDARRWATAAYKRAGASNCLSAEGTSAECGAAAAVSAGAARGICSAAQAPVPRSKRREAMAKTARNIGAGKGKFEEAQAAQGCGGRCRKRLPPPRVPVRRSRRSRSEHIWWHNV
eukprot:scaffold13288_cov107-Isochrysis_galbana.AAC.2